MEIQRIAVVGAGFMGSGIAQLAAQKQFKVVLIDQHPDALLRAEDSIRGFVKKLAHKGALEEPAAEILGRLTFASDLEAAETAEIVIEAIFENVEEKQRLYQALDACCPGETLFGSNTSTIPIQRLEEATRRPGQVVGTHFFFPVPLNPLLELIPTPATLPDVFEIFQALGRSLGKHTIIVKQDVPGFIMNRVFGALTCEAIRLVERGVAAIQDIDSGLTAGYGMSQGPLAKADMAGLDVCLMAFQNIHEMDGAIEPPQLLRTLVAQGKLGRKTGEGFYRYDEAGKQLGPAF